MKITGHPFSALLPTAVCLILGAGTHASFCEVSEWSDWSICEAVKCTPCNYGRTTSSGPRFEIVDPPMKMTVEDMVSARGPMIQKMMLSKSTIMQHNDNDGNERLRERNMASLSGTPSSGGNKCVDNSAGSFPCSGIDLEWWKEIGDIWEDAGSTLDHWGWTSSVSEKEYAIVGYNRGTAFIRVEDGVVIGVLPTATIEESFTRDIKVYDHFAFIVSDPPPFTLRTHEHGMQIFDLDQLDNATYSTIFNETAHYHGFGNAHNMVINEETARAYAAGSNTCNGGMHAIDIQNPLTPNYIGCAWEQDYVHDAQCVIYRGPDSIYFGEEVCFLFSVEEMRIVSITQSDTLILSQEISKMVHQGAYAHQGWINCQMDTLFMGDELDERDDTKTKTYIIDIIELTNPNLLYIYYSGDNAIDHNQYVCGAFSYQANYKAGLRIMDISHARDGVFTEYAYFDTYPPTNTGSGGFDGAWTAFPYFQSGKVLVNSITGGVGVVTPHLYARTRTREIVVEPLEGQVCPYLVEEEACRESQPLDTPLQDQLDLIVHEGMFGEWKDWEGYTSGTFFACGAEIRYHEAASFRDETAANGIRLTFCSTSIWASQKVKLVYDGEWGNWRGVKMCPAGYFIGGARVKFQERARVDNISVTGLKIWCVNPLTNKGTEVLVYSGKDGQWNPLVRAEGNNKFVKMARVRFQDPVGFWGDDTAWNGLELKLDAFSSVDIDNMPPNDGGLYDKQSPGQ